jgi:hypothetical protein
MDYILLINEPNYEQAKYNGISLLIYTSDNFFVTNCKEIRLHREWGRVRIVKGNQDKGRDLCFRPGACIKLRLQVHGL